MSLSIKDEIWILSDGRPGTFSQGIGLAEEFGIQYKLIDISYSALSYLPNCFFSESIYRASLKTRSEFKKLTYLPKLIISCGRRTAPISLYLKKISNKQSRVVQIMNPNLNFKKFDYVILPKHDQIDEKEYANLLTTIGSISKVNEKSISDACAKYSSLFGDIKKTKIALFVGGSSNKTKFTEESAIKLAKISAKVTKNMNALLLVANSRRTGEEISEALKSNLDCEYRFYDWKEYEKNNPYLAIVGYADFFIVTGDSVSMISECASTGKSVFIFDDKEISSKKHRVFHKNLTQEGYAGKITDDMDVLKNFFPEKLQEAKRIANLIKKNIF